ncbi:hypothetical protein FACS1894178_4000 [Bacteroidia bacterium]|nr:hypothetical protein FACS1894178_4000 [Bacteroidia bacterium]
MKKICFIIVLCFVLFHCARCRKYCDHCHQNIIIQNNSERSIFVQYGTRYTPTDSLIVCGSIGCYINFNSAYLLAAPIRYNGWEEEMSYRPYLELLIMDDSTYVHYAEVINYHLIENCDTIRKYVPILHCYQLTLEDLQRMNWTVVYPFDE